ncbi:hypothetical protein V6N11_007908 [Hibiscus sabdariffa]|uniref:Strictosidine synthase conserved region domain-containing protein n=1 Tax=Hibiscus sabdariffa TaxID=183260 RepID=A0ABR2PZ21_9ROSI
MQSYQQLPNPENYQQMELNEASGPESIAFDCKNEGPYVGVSDGRILKWQRKSGLERSCSYFTKQVLFLLLSPIVGPNGGNAQQLATSAEGVSFKLTNALDIDTDTDMEMVHFTDSSTTFQRRHIFLSILTFDKSGRLLKYDPRTKNVTVMYKGLAFPNGVALNKDNSFLLVVEPMRMRILKFKLEDEAKGYVPEQFVQLSRSSDNIKRNEKGEFWIGLNSGRESIHTDLVGFNMDPVGVKYDEEGKVLKELDGNGALTFSSVSEIEEFNGELYIGSVVKPYVGILFA